MVWANLRIFLEPTDSRVACVTPGRSVLIRILRVNNPTSPWNGTVPSCLKLKGLSRVIFVFLSGNDSRDTMLLSSFS